MPEEEQRLAMVRPTVMLEIAAKGLPQNMFLDVPTCEELLKELALALESVKSPAGDNGASKAKHKTPKRKAPKKT